MTDELLDSVAVEVWLRLQFLVELCEALSRATRPAGLAREALDRAIESSSLPRPSRAALAARFLPTGTAVPVRAGPSLDVAASIARWARLTGRSSRARAVLGDALREFLWDHADGGETIDPGFDDSFGHFGRRGLTSGGPSPPTRR